MSLPRILCLRNDFPWMGTHSGYSRLFDALNQLGGAEYGLVQRSNREPGQIIQRLNARKFSQARRNRHYTFASYKAEQEALQLLNRERWDLIHVFHCEQNLSLLGDARSRNGARLVTSIHQPPSWWRLMTERPLQVEGIDGAITMSREQLTGLPVLPRGARHIPHGVDSAFFTPAETPPQEPRVVMTGQWLRDFELLEQSVGRLLQKRPDCLIDLAVPRWRRNEPAIWHLARHPQVHWYTDLPDTQLVELYQKARVLAMPLLDCTANNTVVEGLACGLPVVSTDLPGARDYCTESHTRFCAPGDAVAFADALLEVIELDDAEWRRMSAAARERALELDWAHIARDVRQYYDEVLRT